MPALPVPTDQIVITASRSPASEAQTPASVTIIDSQQIRRLGQPLVPALIRLAPSVAVATSGPAGSFTEVRIRGAENNHTLLFIDGIRANDPATGDFARFELLNSDLASRIEVVRGPQSALWGSDAIGGVVAVNGTDDEQGLRASSEAGSFGFARAAGSATFAADHISLAAALGFQRSTGIDSFGAPGGDKDGYRNLSGRLRGTVQIIPGVRLGAAAFASSGRTEFDGYDPFTFEHTDTLDNTSNRLAAGRLWTEFGTASSSWSGRVGVSDLESLNRNYLASAPLNRTSGSRRTIDTQVQRQFTTGVVEHRLIIAGEAESEKFHARGLSSGLPTDQDRSRSHQALSAEWRASTRLFTGDIAIRRDLFSRFSDATTLRAAAIASLGRGFSLSGSYSEGMAQPTFFDLYGTFPNNFVGNPNVGPESSRGFEGSLRYRRSSLAGSVTVYRQKLFREIVDVFDPTTFLFSTANSQGVSHRSGVEAVLSWIISPALRMTANYAFLHATQPSTTTGLQVRERRRPKHSGSIEADGSSGKWNYGASITYAGAHLDTLEVAPYGVVRVSPYWVASARLAYSVKPGVELSVRASNLFDADYQEVAGYRTEGRGIFFGINFRGDRRSSP